MHSIRHRAYAAAYKTRDDQSAFNPFAARRRPSRRHEETSLELAATSTADHAFPGATAIRTDGDGTIVGVSDAMVEEAAIYERAHSLKQQTGGSPVGTEQEGNEPSPAPSTLAPRPRRHPFGADSPGSDVATKASSDDDDDDDDDDDEGLFQVPLSGPSNLPARRRSDGSFATSLPAARLSDGSIVTMPVQRRRFGSEVTIPDVGPVPVQEAGSPVAHYDGDHYNSSVPFRIVLKTLTGKERALTVSRNMTCEELKILIQDKEGTPPDQQRLLFKGIQMELKRTLGSYNVLEGDAVHLVLRLRGGGGPGAIDLEDESRFKWVRFNKDNTTTKVSPPKEKSAITFGSQMRVVFFNSYTHLLIAFIPAGFAVYYCRVNQIVVFTINFIAIVPSAMELTFAVDDLTIRVGETFGGLISMTFSNAVQVITSIFLLKQRQIPVLQTSLIGAILSNLLLMTGLGFFIGGIHRFEQFFSAKVAQHLGSLLLLAATSLVIPTISQSFFNTPSADLQRQSHGTAIMLLLSYAAWLYFQLGTHPALFREPAPPGPLKTKKPPPGTTLKALGAVGARTAGTVGGALIKDTIVPEDDEDEDEDAEEPQLSVPAAIATVIISTVLIAFNTQFATASINGLLDQAGLTPTFVGLVILPLLGNDPTTLVVAYKDKMDLSLELTLGKCMQTALMVVPLVVVIGWGMRVEEMTLLFNGFEVASLFAGILIVCFIVQDGRSTWIQGALLVEAYVIVGIAAYFVP